MAKPLAIDNSKLKEQARQQRQELARLQQPPEKQPTKNLFGPPIPVSRPNDPTFEQLSNFFGSPVGVDILGFQSNNDCTPTAENQSRNHRLASARHADTRRAEHGDVRRVEHKQNDSRRGDVRQADARQGDARHGDARQRESGTNDSRNGRTNPRLPGQGAATSSLESCAEPPRQGVFEQFDKSSSKTPLTANSDRAPKSSGSRQSVTDVKMKHRTDSSFKDSKLDESSSASSRINGSTNSRSEHQLKPLGIQSKFSPGPIVDSSQTASSLPSGKMNGTRDEGKNPSLNHRTNFGKDYEKVSNGLVPAVVSSTKNVDSDKKLMLQIPKDFEKCDDFVTKVLQEVSIRSPLTGILTPKKADIPFAFPDTSQQQCIQTTIPKSHLSTDDEEEDEDAVKVPVQRPEPHLFDSTGKTIPNQSPNVLDDLDVSDSDSENDPEQTNNLDQRTPNDIGQRSVTDQKSSGSVPVAEGVRRLSESSEASSSEESCTSGSESDSSQSDNEFDRETKKTDVEKDDADELEAKQSKRPTWEIKNFIPKIPENVPFNTILSSPSSPFMSMNRQMSHDFDLDIGDPIAQMYLMSQQQVLSPLQMRTLDVDHAESDHSVDIGDFLSPSIRANGLNPVAPTVVDLSRVHFASPDRRDPKSFAPHSPPPLPPPPRSSNSFPMQISGVDYCAGRPSVVVRIRRSYLSKAKTARHKDHKDDAGCAGTDQVISSTVSSSRSAPAQTDCRSPMMSGGCGSDLTNCLPEAVSKFSKSSSTSNSSMPRTLSSRSSANADCSVVRAPLDAATLSQTSAAPSSTAESEPAADHKENSPAKISRVKTENSYLPASNAVKRKSDDTAGQLDQKKICDRGSLSRKEDRKSQSLQNGSLNSSQKPPTELKSPVVAEEDHGSRSSSSSQGPKRAEKAKTQNGHSRADEKTKKISAPKVNGKISNSETPNSVSSKSTKIATPLTNGVCESPSHANPSINICDDGLFADVNDHGKRSADDDLDHVLLHRPRNPLNGIKRIGYEPEKLESSDVYMQNARKLKHEGDSGVDKFSKVLSYSESILAFVCHCSALEAERAEFARIQKMYQDTLALCQYIVRVMESVASSEKYHLIVISLRIQAIISLRLYNIRKADVAKLKSVLDEYNKSHMSKPKIPSPYQTNHHHSTATTAVSWNHANGTPSPRSPRPSPSPAGSIGSVGSAGSSNGDSAAAMVKPMPYVNGHSLTSIVVPQRIHSVMMNFLNYMNYLHQCHEFWDQAESILVAHSTVADFFHAIDSEFGPIDLHSPTLFIVRYASEVIRHVRTEAKRSLQVVRTD